MCGIVALLPETIEFSASMPLAAEMLLQMSHRGNIAPKASVFGDGIVLGCVRLEIVDRTRKADQPMQDSAGRFAIVFNGELYNHVELRQELSCLGANFRSSSDTEVLLEAYRIWGHQMTEKLSGMYAFCIVDELTNDTFVCRDAFGIKPLYRGSQNTTTAFASEIYPLTNHGFVNIEPVPPGGVIYNGNLVRQHDFATGSSITIDSKLATIRFRELLRRSVRKHASTDLPIAVFCSGGVDSSALLYELCQIDNIELTAYCAGISDSADMKAARLVCDYLHVPLREVIIEPEETLHEIAGTISAIESFEPNHIRAGTVNMLLAARVAADGHQVVVCGEGADELLGGYAEFADYAQKGKNTSALHETFMSELHKTQLQRVDRTTMRYGIEARVPYLDRDLVDFVAALPENFRTRQEGESIVGKWILREAYRGVLPDVICDRRKMPLGEGAGIGDNRPAGIFYENAAIQLSHSEWMDLRAAFPAYQLEDQEQAYYFKLFKEMFGEVEMTRQRPTTNLLPT